MSQQTLLQKTVALVGNPNCGKTTLFNALTGSWQRVGNWAGVTVERKTGYFCTSEYRFEIIDLPGTYTLTTVEQDSVQDERLTGEFLKKEAYDLILNIVDAVNIERNLYITLQCLEQNKPVVVALNRIDLIKREGKKICPQALALQLGCPIIELAAREGRGVETLKAALGMRTTAPSAKHIPYPCIVEEQLARLQQQSGIVRYQLLAWLEGEPIPVENALIANEILKAQQHIIARLGQTADIVIASARYAYIENIVAIVQQTEKMAKASKKEQFTDRLDKIVCHRYLGLPIFLAVMYALFFFAINIGGIFQDFFEISTHAIFVESVIKGLQYLQVPAWVVALLGTGLGKGISTVLTFVPVIGAMFFALAFLEDCGYMARAAFVMDRIMRAIGLPGKSFVPMIVGFGCNVPAIMGTRILDNKRDRVLTVMMSPFMSCGARLAIFTVFVAAFFPQGGQNVIFLLYVIGISMAVFTGWLLKKTLLKGEISPLLLEMPAYEWPHWESLRRHCWHRLRKFVLNAGKLILPVCIIIGGLNNITFHGKAVTESSQESLLAIIGQKIVPVFAPMGIEKENWPAAVGLVTGVLAKEVVIGTLNSLYTSVADETLPTFDLGLRLQAALWSIPENIADLNPFAISSDDDPMSHHAYGEMVKRFNGQANAFAYLLFVLLYFPCISATAAMVREVQRGWTLFSVCWTTGLAYAMAVIYYQCATFILHPLQSSTWIILWLGIGALTFGGIQHYSRRYLYKMLPTRIVLNPS